MCVKEEWTSTDFAQMKNINFSIFDIYIFYFSKIDSFKYLQKVVNTCLFLFIYMLYYITLLHHYTFYILVLHFRYSFQINS